MVISFIHAHEIPSNVVIGAYQPPIVLLSCIIAALAAYAAIAVLRQINVQNPILNIHRGRWLGAFVMGAGVWSMHFTGMLSFKMDMVHTYHVGITIISMLAAISFSYAAFYHCTLGRLTTCRILLNAPVMGIGVSLMHYIGMEAMQMEGEIKYRPDFFAGSIFIAVVASGVAIWIMNVVSKAKRYRELLHVSAAIVMAMAVCGMHYTGMAATVFIPFADCRFDPNQNQTAMVIAVSIFSFLIVSITFFVLAGHRKSSLSIQEERRFLQAVMDAIPDPIFVKDNAHVWKAGNKAFWDLMGGPAENFIGKSDADIFPPEQVAVFLEMDDAVIKTGKISINEECVSDANGNVIIAITKKSPLTMPDGTQGLVGVIHDITERKKADALLKATDAFKQTILDSSKYAIISADLTGKIQTFNKAAVRMLGYTQEEVIGELSPGIFHEREEVARYAQKLSIELGQPIEPGFQVFSAIAMLHTVHETEWTYARKDGSSFPGSLALSVLYNDMDKDDVIGYVGILTDISERKKYEAELTKHRDNLQSLVDEQTKDIIAQKEHAEKLAQAKSEFLSNMSHELRTPMHAILNYANMGLKRLGKEEPEKLEKYLGNIQLSGNRLLGLLNNLLDLARMDSGKMKFSFVEGNFQEVIEHTQMELDSLIKEKNLKIQTDIISADTKAIFDKLRMIQVVVNILSNAIKYSPENSAILVTLSEACLADGGDALCCSITNAGEFIPENELDTIFDKFVQSSKTKTGAGGTGLGLAISREIIDAHGGKIWAENGKVKGVVFSFLLPKNI